MKDSSFNKSIADEFYFVNVKMTRVDDFFTDAHDDLQASLAGKPRKAGRIAGQTLCKRAGCEKRHIVRKNRIYIHGNQFYD